MRTRKRNRKTNPVAQQSVEDSLQVAREQVKQELAEDPNPDDINAEFPPEKKRGKFWEFILALIDRSPQIVKTLKDANVIKTPKP